MSIFHAYLDDCDPNPCQNGGSCTDEISSFTCDCVDGYAGELCSVNIDDCDPNPCQNGGTCFDGVNSFTCTCEDGYTGELCDVDTDNCGINSFSCDCANGFTGITCETGKHTFLPAVCLCYKIHKHDILCMYHN